MSRFTDAIERNWPDYVIAPGASRLPCCISDPPSCPQCDGYGYDYESESLDDCQLCDGTGDKPIDDLTDEELQVYDEGGFSWSECESCGSRLGGNRYPSHAIHKEAFGPNAKQPDNVHHIEICVDCLMFHANGDEPEQWEG